jgi:hypothetical protein
MPQVVVPDRGPQFITAFTYELYKLLEITLAILTAYHPQTDGQTEHVNQVLRAICAYSQVNDRMTGMTSVRATLLS